MWNKLSNLLSYCEFPHLFVKVATNCISGNRHYYTLYTMPERIYNPIMAMGFSAMFTFQLDNTKR